MAVLVCGVRVWAVVLAAAVRVWAVFYGHDVLRSRMELVSHHSSFLHVEEAVFLAGHGLDPYADADYHQPPLVLAMFQACKILGGPERFRALAAAAVILADLVAAVCLVNIVRRKTFVPGVAAAQKAVAESVPDDHAVFDGTTKAEFLQSLDKSPHEAASSLELFALLNPLGIFTAGALSGSVFLHAALAGALWAALVLGDSGYGGTRAPPSCLRRALALHASCLLLALAAHLSLTMAVVALPVCALLARRGAASGRVGCSARVLVGALLLVAAYWAGFLAAAAAVMGGSWSFVTEYYVWIFAMRGSLVPNIGFWWYVFQEVFDRFRGFYLIFWGMQPLLFFVPVTVALRKQPAAAAVVLVNLVLLTQPYPTVGDAAFGLSCLLLFPAAVARIGYLHFLLCLLAFPLVLLPVMWYLWLHPTSGNANFIYFQTIVFQVATIRLVASFTYSAVAGQRILDAGARAKKVK